MFLNVALVGLVAGLPGAWAQNTEWTRYGLTPGETRYSPLNQINTSNVSRLGLAWSYDAGRGGGNQEATPVMANKTVFSITNWSIIFALDAVTGKEKWRWDPEINQDKVRGKICCGVVHRGLALYQNLVIAPMIDGRLVALSMETGKPVWEARVAYTQDNYTMTMAPRIAKNKVIIGVAGAELPTRGFFAAYDAATGKEAWKFYTVPGDPALPEPNPALKRAQATWSGDFWKLGGGGSVWDGMAYDPDLYLCSILAVNPDTGELKWHYQVVPGDSWDFDSVQQLLLADITVRGVPRKVLMQANKDGFFYVIDRTNGQFISGKPFASVNWAKGLDERTGRPFVNAGAHYDEDVVMIMPGPGGAHNWSPMSFNPTTGFVYVPTSMVSSSNYAVEKDFVYKPGQSNLGVRRGPPPADGGRAPVLPATTEPLPVIGPPAPPDNQRQVLVAWDPVTGQEKWRTQGGGSIGGGTLSTAGNIVFQVIPDGRFVAYTADKGEKLMEIQTGLRGGMGPPMTYQIDGKQYITLMGGLGVVIGRNVEPGTPPPPVSAQTITPKVLTFVLDGTPMPAAAR
jgi:quinohemoprotein ethanol dehydrogenase